MINIRFQSNGDRVNYITETSETISNFLNRNSLSDPNALAMINGITVSRGEYNKTFAEFGVEDGTEPIMCMTVKTTNA